MAGEGQVDINERGTSGTVVTSNKNKGPSKKVGRQMCGMYTYISGDTVSWREVSNRLNTMVNVQTESRIVPNLGSHCTTNTLFT